MRQIAEEDERVGVRVVELIPDKASVARAYEVGDERGLARPGGRGDERDGVPEVLLETLGESRARQQRGRGARRQKLRPEEEGGEYRRRRRRRARGVGGRRRVVRIPFLTMGYVRHSEFGISLGRLR